MPTGKQPDPTPDGGKPGAFWQFLKDNWVVTLLVLAGLAYLLLRYLGMI